MFCCSVMQSNASGDRCLYARGVRGQSGNSVSWLAKRSVLCDEEGLPQSSKCLLNPPSVNMETIARLAYGICSGPNSFVGLLSSSAETNPLRQVKTPQSEPLFCMELRRSTVVHSSSTYLSPSSIRSHWRPRLIYLVLFRLSSDWPTSKLSRYSMV